MHQIIDYALYIEKLCEHLLAIATVPQITPLSERRRGGGGGDVGVGWVRHLRH